MDMQQIKAWVRGANERFKQAETVLPAAFAGEATARYLAATFDMECAEHNYKENTVLRLTSLFKLLEAAQVEYSHNDTALVDVWKRVRGQLVLEEIMHVSLAPKDGEHAVTHVANIRQALDMLIRQVVNSYERTVSTILFGDDFATYIGSQPNIHMELRQRLIDFKPRYHSVYAEQTAQFNRHLRSVSEPEYRTVGMVRDHIYAIADKYVDVLNKLTRHVIPEAPIGGNNAPNRT